MQSMFILLFLISFRCSGAALCLFRMKIFPHCEMHTLAICDSSGLVVCYTSVFRHTYTIYVYCIYIYLYFISTLYSSSAYDYFHSRCRVYRIYSETSDVMWLRLTFWFFFNGPFDVTINLSAVEFLKRKKTCKQNIFSWILLLNIVVQFKMHNFMDCPLIAKSTYEICLGNFFIHIPYHIQPY